MTPLQTNDPLALKTAFDKAETALGQVEVLVQDPDSQATLQLVLQTLAPFGERVEAAFEAAGAAPSN